MNDYILAFGMIASFIPIVVVVWLIIYALEKSMHRGNKRIEKALDDIKDLYGDAHRLMNAIEYDEKLDHLDDEDLEIIWSHIKAHYELK